MSFRKYYDTSKTTTYGRSRDSSASRVSTTASTDRPTTVTAKYLSSTPSYKSSIPVLRGERSAKEETPISAIANKYANYGKKDKTAPTYEKKDYTKLTIPATGTSRDTSPVSTSSKYKYSTTNGKSRDVSPVGKSKYSISSISGKTRDLSPLSTSSKYSYTRTSRHLSPGRQTTKKEKTPEPSPTNRDKDIPSKTDKLSSYSSLTSLYSNKHSRTSNYSRPSSRAEVKPDITINRYAIANRLASNYSPTVKLSSVSPVNHSPSLESPRYEIEKSVSPSISIKEEYSESPSKEVHSNEMKDGNGDIKTEEKSENEIETVVIITRHTSPTPPGSSAYVRNRRADMAKTLEKTITRTKKRPEMIDKEIQSDRLDDPTRSSRFGSTARSSVTSWSLYPTSSYTGYAGRYSTKYTTVRDSSSGNSYSDRNSRSTSREPPSKENISRTHSPSDNGKSNCLVSSTIPETNKEIHLYEEKKEDDSSNMSEMIINVNFTLKSPKILTPTTAELVSPEVTITNSLLPPQAPKPDGAVKTKKKVRKSSTDSSSDSSSKKKVVKKRSKSVSSSDSEQVSEASEKSKNNSSISPSKSISKVTSSSSVTKSKQKSRESNSPESSMTQSSMSEDEPMSRSKTVDISRTSADETSLPTDASHKQSSPLPPQRNDEGTEDAKSFLIRALAPVATLFKLRHQDSSNENSRWPDISSSDSTGKDVSNLLTESDKSSKTKNIVASNEDSVVQLKKIRHVESGERAWWLDSSSNIPEGIERLSPPRKSSSESDKSEKYNFFKVRHIESGEKDWWITSNSNESSSLNNNKDNQNSLSKSSSDQKRFPLGRIRHIESGERAWWLSSDKNIPEGIEKLPTPPPQEDSDTSDSEEVQEYIAPTHIPPFPLHLPDDEPLGDRRSPEGLETPKENEDFRGRSSPYENNLQYRRRMYQKGMEKYISRYTDIDDILGTSGQIYSPFMDSILARRTGMPFEEECEEIDPTQVRIHDSTAQRPVITKLRGRNEVANYRGEDELDDATLQIFKDGDYGPYLDLDSTLGEQEEEIEGLQDNRKNALVLRTQLPVRVHAIIEKLLHSQGRELRRALFSLKQILQSDKDLVHDFVANKGLDCLMQVGNLEDQNYIDYILRALGQILLYVDGMHGVMNHKRCVQWLYSLISSKFRHVVKTALKLLVVFVEYTDKNSVLLIDAINVVDSSNGRPPWYNIMKILQDIDASDTELLIYATTLINICLNNTNDRDIYYDQVDALQDQGIDEIIQLYMTKQGTDLDLLRQLQIFEAVLLLEDGDDNGTAIKQLDDSIISSVRRRGLNINTTERRRSKKRQIKDKVKPPVIVHSDPKPKITNNNRPQFLPSILENNKESKELSTALRRRRDRYARQAHHIIQQQELLNNSNGIYNGLFGNNNNGGYNSTNGNITSTDTNYTNGSYINTNSYQIIKDTDDHYYNGNSINGHEDDLYINRTVKNLNLADVLINGNQRYTAGLKQRIQNGTLGHSVTAVDALTVIRHKQLDGTPEVKDDRGILLTKEHSIKDLAQRLTSPVSPTTEEKRLRVDEMAGIVSKAKEELAKSQSKEVIKSPSIEKSPKVHEIKISENELHWEELRQGCLKREYHLCDLDFSDLRQDSDDEMLSQTVHASCGPPPPPPGMFFPAVCNPPPLPGFPPVQRNSVPPPPVYASELSNDSDSSTIKKNKKTVKLFWREIQENPAPVPIRSKVGGFIWDDLPEVPLDTKALEHLFESRTNDLIIKKLMEPKRNLILDTKRSNAINIAMKKLPTPQTIKAAIMKMDANVIGREGIEKLLTMLPTEEEKVKIQEAQYANPDLPLGSAEQFLLTLASINELSSRLKLWVFKLDFDNSEKEIAEPLMDLKQGMDLLKVNKTFKVILATLRSVGSFLNGNQVKGFRLEYLSKVMEVKDTVHKHPLLHHICEMIIEKFPDTTDFFSEVGPVIRASKVDFDILSINLSKLETDCKASWDHMKRIAKHDGSQIFKTKINEFLTDAAERIILLSIIRKRVMSRYDKFLLYLGVPTADIGKTKASEFLKVIAEFALEYRTTRERVLQQLEKRANHRERNKTRGKMIIDVGNYSNKIEEISADSALKELLRTDPSTDSLTEGRRKAQNRRVPVNGEIITADDEIIESLVRSATSKRKPATRERRRNRLCDQKNYFNRTLDGHQWPGPETSNGTTAAMQHR